MERKWWTLIVVSSRRSCCCSTSRSSTSRCPTSGKPLHASLSSLQWVVDAYSLTLAAFLLTAGSLGDRLGRRRVFSIGFGDLHLRLLPVRSLRRPDSAQPRPRPSGRRRRGDVRHLAGADRAGVPGRRSRHGVRRLGRDDRRRGRDRAAGRRASSPSTSAGSGSSSSTSRSDWWRSS